MKELLEKYWNELEHYKNGGKLAGRRWVIDPNDGDSSFTIWYEIDSCSTWMMEDLLTNPQDRLELIINDEYYTYRKALAEGKTIQLNEAEKFADSNRGWVDLSCISLSNSTKLFPVNYYRIKPNEPKFKVGDFVTHESLKITRQITEVDDDFIYFKEGSWALPHVEGFSNKLILWTPIKGEWCWFYDNPNTDKHSCLAQFKEVHGRYFKSITDTPWNFCEPFLNSLPSYLKDK